MKRYLKNSKGSIVVVCFILSMMIMMLAMSTLRIYVNDHAAVLSNSDSIKAYYLAEIAVKEGLGQILEDVDELIFLYFLDLKQHKINYLKHTKKEVHKEYYPLLFNNYLQNYLPAKLTTLKKQKNNPFLDYQHLHRYEIHLKYDVLAKIVIIDGIGTYNHAVKRVRLELILPYQVQEGIDAYDLPYTKIYPSRIRGYYQIPSRM